MKKFNELRCLGANDVDYISMFEDALNEIGIWGIVDDRDVVLLCGMNREDMDNYMYTLFVQAKEKVLN